MRGKATYSALRRWAHMLGFGGHFLTKARRYSVTFTDLRQTRITYRRQQDNGPDYTPFKCQDDVDTETAIVITRLSYAEPAGTPSETRSSPTPQQTRHANAVRLRATRSLIPGPGNPPAGPREFPAS